MATSGTRPLHYEVRDALGLTKEGTAKLLKVSKRTVQRWDTGDSGTDKLFYPELAKAVHAKDPELAGRLALAAGTTLKALGLEADPPPPPAPAGPPMGYLVDTLLCVAANAMDAKPAAIRPGIAAAFTFARQLGLDVEAVERELVGEPPKALKIKG